MFEEVFEGSMSTEIDVANYRLVTTKGKKVVVMVPPVEPMTKDEALSFAAWLVTMAHPQKGEFEKYLDAVQNS